MEDEYKLFHFRYCYEDERSNGRWHHTIVAKSEEDARRRFHLLRHGECMASEPVPGRKLESCNSDLP